MFIDLCGEHLELLPQKAVFWPDRQILFLADLHLGKVSHFRKAGIPLPQLKAQETFWNLTGVLNTYKPSEVYFLGDLFHSTHNVESLHLFEVLSEYPAVQFYNVPGNHDRHAPITGNLAARIQALPEQYHLGPFLLSHEPLENSTVYNLCGHVHPAAVIRGKGRQRLRIPCFFFGEKSGILPAFGSFTGTYALSGKQSGRMFACTQNSVVEIPPDRIAE